MKRNWKDLSLREKIGQTVILLSNPEKEIEECGSLEAFLEKYPVGGFFVGDEVIKDVGSQSEKVNYITSEYRKISKVPLLFPADMEAGSGHMIKDLTTFPHMMALGATNSEELAYSYGKGTALESVSVGVNWTFSPVADLSQNMFNPIINNRAVSDNPELGIPLLKAVVKGMQDYGLAATAKHFPGDGVDYRDQHLITTKNSLSLEDWKKNHGAVFKALIDAGVNTIMTGHIAFPAYQKEMTEERYLPATLSYELTTKLLKQDLGFNGVVVSDALIMGGFLGWYERSQAEVECFKAGTDMLLWPTLGYFDLMEKAILKGEVSEERLNDALERIWGLKEKLGLFDEISHMKRKVTEVEAEFVKSVSDNVAEKSITLLRDRKKQLPLGLSSTHKVLMIDSTNNNPEHTAFKNELEIRGIEVETRRYVEFQELARIESKYDLIFYTLRTGMHSPIGPVDLFGEDGRNMWTALSTGSDKSIVISFSSPYFFNQYFEAANIYINAYSYCEASQKAVVKCLFGEIPFVGVSPVSL